ncbi:MAG: hydantoinase/oxoprolinase family protein [Lysobacterales bacterium]
MAKARLAVDIGGTFTDVVLLSDCGKRWSEKRLTTHQQPEQAMLSGIAELLAKASLKPSDLSMVLHGTTLATNALIERRGATTALLTTAGHRDVLEMAFEDRFEQYDININRATPLVPRHLRLPIVERLISDGSVRHGLDEPCIEQAMKVIDQHNVESVAIGFLHSYVNPDHEQRCAEVIRQKRPDLSLTLSSEVCPEIREFERFSTACANAYVQPLMASYLHRLRTGLADMGIICPALLMTSGGGLTRIETAARFPIRLVESGPAGGAILAASVAAECQAQQILSFDMGGTTAKLCLIDNYQPLQSRSFEVDRSYRFRKGSGLPLRIPVIEMVEIGAGGGSIAHVDKLERLRVGPRSAGSEPGPAAYGLGGENPTVTDADACLGKLPPERFAGGKLTLDIAAANQSVRAIGEQLSLSTSDAALGISDVVEESMASAARAHAAEFGLDLRQRDMVAFGGAAPLHAASLAARLGVSRVIIPAQAGVGSAVGFLLARLSFEVVRSRRMRVSNLDVGLMNQLLSEMFDEASAVIRPALDSDQPLVEHRTGFMRYAGQGHELAVTLPEGELGDDAAEQFTQAFESAYRRLYGRVIDDVEIELLSMTLSLSGPEPGIPPAPGVAAKKMLPSTPARTLIERAQASEAQVVERETLQPGARVQGPALVTEDQTTTVVPSGFTLRVDAQLNLVMQRSGSP